MKKQLSHKFLNPINKNDQLFDAIHNYLDNPKRAEAELNPTKIIKEKHQLEDKLKEYEAMLGRNHNGTGIRHKESSKT